MLVAYLLAPSAVRAQAASEVDVTITEDWLYVPDPVIVEPGTLITWTNTDVIEHTVTADDGAWDSDLIIQGDSWSTTFDTPGTYGYYCVPHGAPGSGMFGVIVVLGAEEAPPAEMAPPAEEAPPDEMAPPVEDEPPAG
jgi:plastocyanin